MPATATIEVQPVRQDSLPTVSSSAARARAAEPLRLAAASLTRRCAEALSAELGCEVRISAELLVRAIPSASLRLRAHACPIVLECAATGEALILELETSVASALLERLSGGDGVAALPFELTEAELAAAAYLTLVALAPARSTPLVEEALAVRLAETGSAAEATRRITQHREWLSIELALELPRAKGAARLLLPTEVADRLIAHAGAPAPAELSPELLGRALRASLRTGAVALDAAELDALGEGDVVLVTGARRTASGFETTAELRFSTFTLRGALSGDHFTLASIEDATSAEAVMKTHSAPPPLPIELKVELGQLRIPLSALATIEPGTVLRLGVTLSDHVTLLLGDAPFARAELVDVAGELGARVVELVGGAR